MVMNSSKTQLESEAEGDKTEESENSGKAIASMLKRVTISRKQSLKFSFRLKLTHQHRLITVNIVSAKTY